MVLLVACTRRCSPALLAGALVSACGPSAITDDAGTTTSPEGTEGDDDVGEDSSDSATSSTSTSTTSSTDDDPSADEYGVIPDDEGDNYGYASCDVWAQDCPYGEKCVPYASSGDVWDDLKCVPVMGDKLVGEECIYDGPVASTDDCDETTWCFGGTCHAFCTGTQDQPMCADEASVCMLGGDTVLTLCFPTCDPIAQDCLPDEGCYWTLTDFVCLDTTTNAATGEPCGFLQDCAPGNVCTDANAVPGCRDPACCAAFCHLAMPDCDLPGTSCVAFFEEGMAPPEYEHVGVCISG